MTCTYRLNLLYDGTHFAGWQIQPHSLSIQEMVEKAATLIAREPVRVIGAGRTDAGVHALNQVAHFQTTSPLDIPSSFRSFNGLLPKEIRVKELALVDNDFHAQRSSTRKEYHYFLCTKPFLSPFTRFYVHHETRPLSESLLRQAACSFVGTHDFTSFANSAHSGPAAKNPIRTLYRLDIVPTDDGFRLEFEGNGFLYKMVRNIVGLMLDVAASKRPLEDIERVFQAKDRRLSSKAAPAKGLFLVSVFYDQRKEV